MTRDAERDRLATAKMDAWERYMANGAKMAEWNEYLNAWQKLHEYDRARWNATHENALQVQPEVQAPTWEWRGVWLWDCQQCPGSPSLNVATAAECPKCGTKRPPHP